MVSLFVSIVFIVSVASVCLLGIWGIFLLVTSRGFTTAPTVACPTVTRDGLFSLACERLDKSAEPQTVIDLGSGFGTLLIPLARRYPQHRFIGYEWGWTGYGVSRLRSIGLKNITFYRRDLFTADLSEADIVFLFFITFLLERAAQKVLTESPKTVQLYTCRFQVPNRTPVHTLSLSNGDNIYVYQKEKTQRKKRR